MNKIIYTLGLLAIITGFYACGKSSDDSPAIAIQQVTIPAETKMATGLTHKLQATISPANATSNYTLQWASDNQTVATVAADGTVTAVSKGTANVRVTVLENGALVQNVASSTKVTVEDFAVSFTTPNGNLDIGKTQKLQPVVGPQGFTATLEWASANTNVATVAADGTITARNVGESVITVTVKEQPTVKATYRVSVGAGTVTAGSGVGDINDGPNW